MESVAAVSSSSLLCSYQLRRPLKGLVSFSKGELIRLPAQCLILVRSKNHSIGAEVKISERKDFLSRRPSRLNATTSDTFSSPKTGTLGEDRFKDGAVPGTYWNDSLDLGEEATVCFNTGSNTAESSDYNSFKMLLTVSEKVGRNRELNNAQRKLICLHKEATSITNRELSLWATEKFQFPVSEMTISRTLKRRDQWISDKASPDGKRARKLVCPEVEEATYAWFLAMQDKGAPLTDALVCEAAKRFYSSVEHTSAAKQLVFSHGWLGRFKKRHGIKGYVKHGEVVPVETRQPMPDQIDAIKAIISDFEPGDIFSMEETGLLYRLEPNKGLAAKRTSFLKKANERITVALTANMDGSMKLPPLVINKYNRPHAFASRNISNPVNLGVLWHANRLAWMSITIFEKFLQDFENRMMFAGKKRVLLLVDSAHSHKFGNVEKDLRITVVRFLPSSSGLGQPLDAGLVSCFKAYYRTLLLKHQANCRLMGKDARIDVYNAVVLLEKAWRSHVTPITISNCWRYTELCRKRSQPHILENLNGSPGHWQPRHSFELNEQLNEISELLEQFGEQSSMIGLVPDMTALEYVHFEEQNGFAISHEPSEDEIWETSLATDEIEEETDVDGPVENVLPINFSSVQGSLESIAMYLLQQQEDVTDLLQKLRVLDSNLASHHKAVARQRDITRLYITTG
ncbi:hypothetical protein MPTK1_8g17760 [Marchantia polymorpha subsp. ruderalis]